MGRSRAMQGLQGCFLFFLLCVGATLAFSSQNIVQREFAAFKAKYGKTYEDYDEEVARYEIFRYNFEAVKKQNKMMKSYTVGINQFSDLTHQEFKDQYLGYKNPSNIHSLNKKTSEDFSYSTKDLPASVDWREKGAISKVKNQGQCGSCWAFATTEMIESYAQISSQEMVELSTQQVTSCTPNPTSCGGVGGCKGSIAQLGYIRLAKTPEAECGTDSSPLSGTGCAGGPGSDVQHVCGQCGMLFDASYPLGAESIHAPRK